MRRRLSGLTLIELLVGLVVMTVLTSLAVPGFQGLREQSQIRSAGMAVYADLQLARSEAIKRSREVTVCFSGLDSIAWSYRLHDSGDCSGSVIERVDGQDFPGIKLSMTGIGGDQLSFQPRRHQLVTKRITLSSGLHDMQVKTWNNGIIRTCSDHGLPGVPVCE
ncbi:GspH/FimT family pseudopilin [Oceanimonas baumannii]|uniref:GspH/FimT family pseudopilin n=1 Tax=Oceanimonas baumannii TaxID=129578 RepID=UPI001D17E9FC|nr:GspH/FimT family pseudopilin [Oceanimonas baumannii]MCC4265708.1 GspH/FimT family pseudopilin [Oceanimonas baumannii]